MQFYRTTSGAAVSRDFTENGLVRDGTPCGRNLICVNQTCVSIFPYIDQTKCPTNNNNVECYGQGVSNIFFVNNSRVNAVNHFQYYTVFKAQHPLHIFVWFRNLYFCNRFAQIKIDAFVMLDLLDQIVQL